MMMMMLIPTEHKRVVSPPFVCIHDGASSHSLHRLGHKTLCRNILNNTHRDISTSLQDPKDDGSSSGSSPSLTFALPPRYASSASGSPYRIASIRQDPMWTLLRISYPLNVIFL